MDEIIYVIFMTGFIISMMISYKAYEKKWAKLYRYAPPIYGFFLGIALEILKFNHSPPKFVEAVFSMMFCGWIFWLAAWLEQWSQKRKVKRNKTNES